MRTGRLIEQCVGLMEMPIFLSQRERIRALNSDKICSRRHSRGQLPVAVLWMGERRVLLELTVGRKKGSGA